MNNLHMKTPIWVWLYDYGPLTHPDAWKQAGQFSPPGIVAYPQAHTYAFMVEKETSPAPGSSEGTSISEEEAARIPESP